MKVDVFTKICGLAIAVFLGIITLQLLFSPEVSRAALGERKLDYVMPIGMTLQLAVLLDTRNGNLWVYDVDKGTANYSGTLEELGKPLVKKQK